MAGPSVKQHHIYEIQRIIAVLCVYFDVMVPPPRVAVGLTSLQKQLVAEEHQRLLGLGETTDQKKLADWAHEKFSLKAAPHQSTISRILKQSKGTPRRLLCPSRKRNRPCKSPALEKALHSWVNSQVFEGKDVNGMLVREAALRIQTEMNKMLPPEQQLNMRFSNGWLDKFQKRNNVSYRKPRNKDDPASEPAATPDPNPLRSAIKDFKKKDVWTAHEFGLCYRMPPEKSSAMTKRPGHKSEYARLTFLACTNGDGSEKFPLMAVGKVPKPSSFKGKTGAEHGFDYVHNKKAWVTSGLFFDWLDRFDSFIGSTTPNRKVALLVDNCNAHGTKETLPKLCHVEVIYFPLTAVSNKQAMKSGIVASLKARYKVWQYLRAIDELDAGEQNIYAIDQLTAMNKVKDMWTSLPTGLINECWKRTRLFASDDSASANDSATVDGDVMTEVMKLVKEIVPPAVGRTIALNDVINTSCELECTGVISEAELAIDAVAAMITEEEDHGDTDDDIFVSQTVEEKLRNVVIAKKVLEEHGLGDPDVLKGLTEVQVALRLERVCPAQRTQGVNS